MGFYAKAITPPKEVHQEMRPNMSTATYKSLQANLDKWSTRIDKGQLNVRLRSTAARKIKTGAQLFNQPYPLRDRKIRTREEIRWVAFFAVLIFLNLPAIAFAQSSCPGIRENSEHKKQYWKYSLWNFQITRGFSQEIFGFGKGGQNKENSEDASAMRLCGYPAGNLCDRRHP